LHLEIVEMRERQRLGGETLQVLVQIHIEWHATPPGCGDGVSGVV
jgi:hypothetical protein